MAIKESNGIHKGEIIFCPVNGWDCPYFEDGVCYIANPIEECDDFAIMFSRIGKSGKDYELLNFPIDKYKKL